VRVRVHRAGLAGTSRSALARDTGRSAAEIATAIESAQRSGALESAGDCVLATAALERIEQNLVAALDAYHAVEPLRPGMSRGRCAARCRATCRTQSPSSRSSGSRAPGAIALEADHVRLAKHRPTLDRAAQKACDAISSLIAGAALDAPALREVAAHVGLPEASARDLLAHLEREHQLVRARPDLWFDARAVEALRERIRAHFESHDELDTPAYKALIGTSRRTAVPLMELFDAERLTVRVGEVRKLRRKVLLLLRAAAQNPLARERHPDPAPAHLAEQELEPGDRIEHREPLSGSCSRTSS
jgi:selenocysteine-specific elongation factor